MKNKGAKIFAVFLLFAAIIAISPTLYYLIWNNGAYPEGSDTMYHIFRGDLLYKAILKGEGYPLYNALWYNGIEPMRYWPPLSPVVYALCEFLASGDVFGAYIYYCILIFILGLLAWTYIGFRKNRPVLGVVLGILWFFLPNNLYAMFGEGNLPRSLSMVFIPLFVFAIYKFLENGKTIELFAMIVLFLFIILCHLGYAGMVSLAVIGYLIVQRFFFKNRRRMLKVVVAMLVSYMLSGLYLIPSLHGGINADNSETVVNFFQSLTITLNPAYRVLVQLDTFYFGLAAFVIAVLGALASNKKSAPGFINAIVIVLMTTPTAYSILQVVPGSNMLWMLRFLSIALCMVFLSLMYWEKIKKWVLVLFAVLICADIIPSLAWIYEYQSSEQPFERLSATADETYIAKAQELCNQRIALMDLSDLGATGAYLVSGFKNPKPAVFGAGWEAAATADNITRLNRAMNDEYFDYMFDRLIDLGADTVIIQKAQAVYGERTLVRLDAAAERCGYDILYENEGYMLYHLDTGLEGFGSVTEYDAIGIGYSAYSLSFAFPNIRETNDDYIDHYTYDELSKYETVYLSGFYYEDRDAAEKLVTKLSENGTRVVILADGIPEDRDTRTKSFLGVTCNVIQFENGYPILYSTDFGELDCDLFPRGYSKWVTYYLNGLKDVKGTIYDNDIELAFYGTGINENVCYIGLNIPFYYYLTQDARAELIMQWVMGMEPGQLPDKEIYPVSVSITPRSITINTDTDMLKTSLSFHDNFVSAGELIDDNNLLTVRAGETKITLIYPYLKDGIVVSLLGVLLMILFLIYAHRSYRFDLLSFTITRENVQAASAEESDVSKVSAMQPIAVNMKEFDIPLSAGDDFDLPFGKRG